MRNAKFKIGQVVRHRLFPFRGVVFDIDPEFNNTEEWYQSIPAEVRPHKDQPFYHLFAENAESEYIAYVSEQNLLPDTSGEPMRHRQVAEAFERGRKRQLPPAPFSAELTTEGNDIETGFVFVPLSSVFCPPKRTRRAQSAPR